MLTGQVLFILCSPAQKQFNALYHTPLVTTTNVMFCGVATNKVLLNTPTMSYPMEMICMGAAFNRHCKIFFLSMLPQQLPQN